MADAVDDVDGVVRRVGHVEETPWSVHGGVIEAAGGHVRGKIDVADMLQRHASLRDA